MNFLAWYNPLTWLSAVSETIVGAIVKGLRSLLYSLSVMIYSLIVKLYNLFEVLCHARLLDSEVLKSLSDRVGLILGLVMLFMVTFSFIQMLINPDVIEDKEKGAVSVIKKVLLVIVMLGVSNFVFTTLYKVQSIVINSHVITKLLLPYEVDTDNFGSVLSADLFTSFYRVNSDLIEFINTENDVDSAIEICYNESKTLKKRIYSNSNFELGYSCLNESVVAEDEDYESQETFIMDFDWLLMMGFGLATAYFLAMYCFKVGVRTIQLAVLEILSPMAFISYLSPKKDTMFSKWSKMYFSTYIDVFIRIGIINFVMFLIATILDTSGGWEFWKSIGNPTDDFTVTLISAVMILALLTFAHKAPELLKDLFPVGAASKLGFGASMKDVVGLKRGLGTLAGVGAGAVTGAIAGVANGGKGIRGVTGLLGGIGGGIFRGGHAGFGAKGIGSAIGTAAKNQTAYAKRMADLRAQGGTWLGSKIAGVQGALGLRTGADRYDLEKEKLEGENAKYNQMAGYFDAAKKRAEGKILEGKFAGKTTTAGEQYANMALQAKQRMEMVQQQMGNLDMTSDDYEDNLEKLEEQMAKYRADYNKDLDLATQEYISARKDDVVNQNINMAQAVIDNNSSLAGFSGLSPIIDYATFDAANVKAKGQVSTNTEALSRNQSEGERARTNAKYSGRK